MSYYKVDDLFSTSITPGNIHSPLNYTGSKYRLLPQILPLFPKNIDTFVDLFCGGCNVGVNVSANKYLFNDVQSEIIGLYKTMIDLGADCFITKAINVMEAYKLINKRNIMQENKTAFTELKNDTNKLEHTEDYYVNLFILVQFSFCNQIRFNRNGEYNMTAGDGVFSINKFEETRRFIRRLTEIPIEFSVNSFVDFDYTKLDSNSFVYLDPPYLITEAIYNSGWGNDEETKLLDLLGNLSSRNIKWALSNVIDAKGKRNNILYDWLSDSNYATHHLDVHYTRNHNNTGQHTHFTDEVLITNY